MKNIWEFLCEEENQQTYVSEFRFEINTSELLSLYVKAQMERYKDLADKIRADLGLESTGMATAIAESCLDDSIVKAAKKVQSGRIRTTGRKNNIVCFVRLWRKEACSFTVGRK
jgi:hypothetical protein